MAMGEMTALSLLSFYLLQLALPALHILSVPSRASHDTNKFPPVALATIVALAASLALVISMSRRDLNQSQRREIMDVATNEGPRRANKGDSTDSSTQRKPESIISLPNPFWPAGVDASQVDELVEECLRDPSINIKAVPDFLESQIYKITIELTLNLIYQLLANLHGITIFAHQLQMQRIASNMRTSMQLSEMQSHLDAEELDAIAERLIANEAVKQPLLPVMLQKQIYVNCLTIIFRLLDLLSTTLVISLCGHDIKLTVSPSRQRRVKDLTSAADVASRVIVSDDNDKETTTNERIATPINTKLLMKVVAEQEGVDLSRHHNFFERLANPFGDEFMVQLHTSLYSLILGILDDLLERSEIELLSERVLFDIVAVDPTKKLQVESQENSEGRSTTSVDEEHTAKSTVGIIGIAIGVVAGVAIGLFVAMGAVMVKKDEVSKDDVSFFDLMRMLLYWKVYQSLLRWSVDESFVASCC